MTKLFGWVLISTGVIPVFVLIYAANISEKRPTNDFGMVNFGSTMLGVWFLLSLLVFVPLAILGYKMIKGK